MASKQSPAKVKNDYTEEQQKDVLIENLYPKLKNCKTTFEKITNNTYCQIWFELDSFKVFKAKNNGWFMCSDNKLRRESPI